MNNDQRKFLIAKVEETYRKESEGLRTQIGQEPSLNNYLIAAFLDGSIKMKPLEEIKIAIKNKVIKLGPGDALLKTTSSYRRADERTVIDLEANVLFVYPDAYTQAYQEWEQHKKEVEEKINSLYAKKETIIMKIQIGSNASLDKLVDSVDNMIDLTLMNDKLMLKENNDK